MTDSQQNERSLSSIDELPRYVLDRLAEGCQVIDSEFRYRYVNDAVVAHGKTTREALLGKTMMECYPGIENTPVFAQIATCIRDGVRAALENEFVYPDGSKAWFELRIQPLADGVVLLSVDITERKLTELDIRRSESLRRAVYSHLPNPTWVWRNSGDGFVLVDANRAALDSVRADEPSVGATPAEVLPALTMLDGLLAECVRRDEVVTLETEAVLHPGRGPRVYVLRCGPAPPDMAIVHIADVTEQRRAEEQLATTHRLESLGRLAGGVAHDFNNLLSVILGCAEMALDTVDEDHESRRNIEHICAASHQATDLVSQLLAFGRRQPVSRRNVTLGAIVNAAEPMLRRLLDESIALEIRTGTPGSPVLADPGQLSQAVINLVLNARDAMPEGGRIAVRTGDVSTDSADDGLHADLSPGEYAFVTVTDGGVGMDEATLAQVFEPFFTTKPMGRGTGLGLSTVYGVVNQNDGTVRVRSEPGVGSTFAIFLPHSRSDATANRPAVDSEDADEGGRGEHILVVDDGKEVGSLAARILTDAGYRVSLADSGKAALEHLGADPGDFDLLLTDVMMPGMSGAELADAVRVQRPDLPVLFMSGYADDVLDERVELGQDVDLVRKPFSPKELRVRVRRALDVGDGAPS